jgi:membrane protein required for colicin V production
MNGFDVGLLVLLVVLVAVGLLKGMVRILIGIAATIAAFVLAARFHGALAERLTWLGASEPVRALCGYLLIFLGTMLLGGILAWLCRRLVKVALLGWADRLGGAVLGLVAAVLIAALVVLPLVAYSPRAEATLQRSALAPWLTSVSDVANRVVPAGMSERYRQKVESLRRYWRERSEGSSV